MWNFKGTLWNSTQNILPIHWKIWLLFNIEILRALRFKSSYVLLKHPLVPHTSWTWTWIPLCLLKPWHLALQFKIEYWTYFLLCFSRCWLFAFVDQIMPLKMVNDYTWNCTAFEELISIVLKNRGGSNWQVLMYWNTSLWVRVACMLEIHNAQFFGYGLLTIIKMFAY